MVKSHQTKLLETHCLSWVGKHVILGMDWMNKHGVLLDISSRAVEFNSSTHGHSVLYLPHSEHVNSCAYAMKDIRIEDIPVVRECADVFSG